MEFVVCAVTPFKSEHLSHFVRRLGGDIAYLNQLPQLWQLQHFHRSVTLSSFSRFLFSNQVSTASGLDVIMAANAALLTDLAKAFDSVSHSILHNLRRQSPIQGCLKSAFTCLIIVTNVAFNTCFWDQLCSIFIIINWIYYKWIISLILDIIKLAWPWFTWWVRM